MLIKERFSLAKLGANVTLIFKLGFELDTKVVRVAHLRGWEFHEVCLRQDFISPPQIPKEKISLDERNCK